MTADKKFSRSIFCFRRDLRLHDNSALNQACRESAEVIPTFVFDEIQLSNNPYRSDHCVQFMMDSLFDLEDEIGKRGGKLEFLRGQPHEALRDLAWETKAQCVFVNRDYTPYSRKRDSLIEDTLRSEGVRFVQLDDCLLNPPGTVLKGDGQPYSMFTPFLNRSRLLPVAPAARAAHANIKMAGITAPLRVIEPQILANRNPRCNRGGRRAALSILRSLGDFSEYAEERNFPALGRTTRLSAHLKFGTLSARELLHVIEDRLGKDSTLITELYWRDFFSHIGFHFPHVFGSSFKREYDRLKWRNDQAEFQRWCDGTTGFPIVDAGMREMNETGFMHNRVRMITASFLTKDLHVDWREGERYFARKLVDYDPAVNNGNWQWAASTGCDAQPYFRIFNPWLQQKKFDPECEYIKHWIPELKSETASAIHNYHRIDRVFRGYPKPHFEHAERAEEAEEMFRNL